MLLALGVVTVILGCEQIQKAADVVTNPTARELYERNFNKEDSLVILWKEALQNAQQDSILVTLPYAESGHYSSEYFYVYSYDLQLREGEKLIVSVSKQPDSALVFISLFRQRKDATKNLELLKESEPNSSDLSYTVGTYGIYKVTVQAELKRSFPFQLMIYTQPTYLFPVQGAGNKNVQSLWAAPRDDGQRSHEGIDIFAPKGTPLLAVTDGRIVSTGDRGLGGKQVWLRDGTFGKTIYYAHLDSIAVLEGRQVNRGETIGFVGNTGNAETTEPHLHFGIYNGSSGPVNPYPYIKRTEIPDIPDRNTCDRAVVIRNLTPVHQGPSSALREVGTLSKNDTVSVLGAHREWFHMVSKDNLKGFIRISDVKPCFQINKSLGM